MWKIAATPGLVAIGCMIPVGSWWFAQLTGLVKIHSPTIGDVSVQAIQAMLILQLLSVCLFSPHWAAGAYERSPQQPACVHIGTSVIAAILPAWPLLAILALASGVSASQTAMGEASLLAAGFALALFARAFQNQRISAEISRLSLGILGLVTATLAWLFRLEWFDWLGL